MGWSLALAAPPLSGVPERPWSAAQLIGPPDAELGVDDPRAWAPSQQDGGLEWLEADLAGGRVTAIRIVESFHPGAVVRVLLDDRVVWKGAQDPTRQPGVFEVAVQGRPHGERLRIELDTGRVAGWNEIDAVGVVDASGQVRWATAARVSSHFGQGPTAPHPLEQVRGRQVTLQLRGGSTITGVLDAIHGEVLMIRDGERTTVVFQEAVDAVSY